MRYCLISLIYVQYSSANRLQVILVTRIRNLQRMKLSLGLIFQKTAMYSRPQVNNSLLGSKCPVSWSPHFPSLFYCHKIKLSSGWPLSYSVPTHYQLLCELRVLLGFKRQFQATAKTNCLRRVLVPWMHILSVPMANVQHLIQNSI